MSTQIPPVQSDGHRYRKDGVRIQHELTASMAEKYGLPGNTDHEGFDPYADTVGAGIYGGTVKRDSNNNVVIGRQYQNHNPRPGPVYSGGGYTPVSKAISKFHTESQSVDAEETTLGKLLQKYPDLANDVSTGGAAPLHTCGMSQRNQYATKFLIKHGANVDAVDTYGYTPLHRMASNNLHVGADALLKAGADPQGLVNSRISGIQREPPMVTAQQSRAIHVLKVLKQNPSQRIYDLSKKVNTVSKVVVYSSGNPDVIGEYMPTSPTQIPKMFEHVCHQNNWEPKQMWEKLNGSKNPWYKHASGNGAYIYFNKGDGKWWIDGTDGHGVFIAPGTEHYPPGMSTRWKSLKGDITLPTLGIFRK